MLKLLLIFSALFVIITAKGQVKYGIKGGANIATVRDIDADISKARLSFNAGIAVEGVIADQLVIRPELEYSSKGFGVKATAVSMTASQRLNYITLPVLLGYYPSKKFSVLAGPEFGYLSKAVTKSQGITSDNTGFYRRFDIGADLGAAYNVSKQFTIEARYNYGFKDLVNTVFEDNAGNITGQGKDGANSVLQFGFVLWLSE